VLNGDPIGAILVLGHSAIKALQTAYDKVLYHFRAAYRLVGFINLLLDEREGEVSLAIKRILLDTLQHFGVEGILIMVGGRSKH